jgi:hypothetical protein
MNKKHHRFPGKYLLFLLIFPFFVTPVFAANRTLVLFPVALYMKDPTSSLRHGLKTMFLSRLSGGGLDVVTDERFGSLLTADEKTGKISRLRVEEITRKLKADYAVFGSVTSMGGGSSLDLTLLDLTKTQPKLIPVSESMTEDQFIPRVADVANRFRAIIEGRYAGSRRMIGGAPTKQAVPAGIFSKLGQPESPVGEEGFFRPTRQYAAFQPIASISLRMTLQSLDVGDLTGDGNLELLALDRNELRIYGKKGQGYGLKDTFKASMGEDFLKVSVGDIDRNGKDEIYLVSFYGQSARTTVLEWNRKFRKLYRKTGHLLVVKNPGGGPPNLLFENTKPNELYGGKISLMGYNGSDKLKEIRRLPHLKKARFYTLTLYDLNKDGSPEFIGLGEHDSLRVWDSDGKILWSDDQRIGGTNNVIQVGDVPSSSQNKPWVSINSRLTIIDIDGDGKKELIAVKNIALMQSLETMNIYVKGSLIAYRFDGASLTQGWNTKEIPYCTTDIQVASGTLFLGVQKGRLSKIGKGRSRIMWFHLR